MWKQTTMDTWNICSICFGLSANQARKCMWKKYWLGRDRFAVGIHEHQLVSSSKRCAGCRIILSGLDLVDPSHRRVRQNKTKYHILYDLRGLPLRVEFNAWGWDKFDEPRQVEFFTTESVAQIRDESTSCSCIGQASLISTAPTVEYVARLALSWLSRCSDSHKACHEPHTSLLPKRVVDIGSSKDSVPRLLQPGDGDAACAGRYIALSYCWGPVSRNLKTTRETLDSHLREIPFDSMPRTFQEAIQLSRLLGVPYIWIDSLCIIQQDEEDWTYHAARMSSIYGNAWIVLSATASATVHDGLLVDRTEALREHNTFAGKVWASSTLPRPISNLVADDQSTTTRDIFVRRRLPHSAVIPEVVYPTSDCPLLTRGWTFQERILATRTLHFLPTEVLWECRSQYWCECMSCNADLYDEIDPRIGYNSKLRGSKFNKVMLTYPKPEHLEELWRTIVSSYSYRKFTRYTDRLPALWGVATRISLHTETSLGGYMAGLWGRNLAVNLMWQAELPPSAIVPPNNTDPIPSWSWASTPFPVKWETHDLVNSAHAEASILSTDWEGMSVVHHYTNKAVPRGTIDVLAPLTAATLDPENYVLWKPATVCPYEARNSTNPDISPRGRREAAFYPDIPFGHIYIGNKKSVQEGKVITVALMFSYKKRAEGYIARRDSYDVDAEVTYWWGLALSESKEDNAANNDVSYRRVGIVKGRYIKYYSDGWFGGIDKSHITIL
ncbi:Heterokaryon incompatibility protein (HET) domain containing protein [Naviculisporaceae sp. PSN 640]